MAVTYDVFCDPTAANFNTLRTDNATGNNVGVIGATNIHSSILGGVPAAAPNNFINSDFSVILMGQNHLIDETSNNSFIGAGDTNAIVGGTTAGGGMQGSEFSFLGGGSNNTIGSPPAPPVINFGAAFSVIAGGSFNSISTDNVNISQHNTIGGGNNNQIFPGSNNNTIGGGQTNRTSGYVNTISGGGQNTILDSCSTIGGGWGNLVNQGACGSFIGGGDQNTTFGCLSTMPGGRDNHIYQTSDYSFVGGGLGNAIANLNAGCLPSPHSFIGGGFTNCIDTDGANVSDYNVLVGGSENFISPGVIGGVIGGGQCNEARGSFSFMGGGACNVAGTGAVVVGGCANEATGQFSFIGGGGDPATTFPVNNEATNDYSFVGNGLRNCASGRFSFVGNGGGIGPGPSSLGNCAEGAFSFIGNGFSNNVGAGADYGFIGSGDNNVIGGGILHNFIGGGRGNNLTGNCSAILGGDNNSDGGNNAVGIYGSGIVAPIVPGPSSMHVDELVLHNIPDGTLGIPPYPAGSLYFINLGGGVCQVYVV